MIKSTWESIVTKSLKRIGLSENEVNEDGIKEIREIIKSG